MNCSWIDDHPPSGPKISGAPSGAVVNCTISALVAARLILATGVPSDAAPNPAIEEGMGDGEAKNP